MSEIPEIRQIIFQNIHEERLYQESRAEGTKTFDGEFDSLNTANDWVSFIVRYLGNSCGFGVSPFEFQNAMIKVAAIGVAAIEAVDKNKGLAPRHYDRNRLED